MKSYIKPEVLGHEVVSFKTETVHSCKPPKFPAQGPLGPICVDPIHGSYDPYEPKKQ